MDDVIIIGGSFAGLAGALQLGRARRNVTVLDTGLPRNRFAGHSHGLLGHDHKPPLDILAEARRQLARYPTIRLVNARADSISGAIDDFSVLTGDGEGLAARQIGPDIGRNVVTIGEERQRVGPIVEQPD